MARYTLTPGAVQWIVAKLRSLSAVATTAADGLMSAADKAALDRLSAAGTAQDHLLLKDTVTGKDVKLYVSDGQFYYVALTSSGGQEYLTLNDFARGTQVRVWFEDGNMYYQ